jgi:hypothetical protein
MRYFNEIARNSIKLLFNKNNKLTQFSSVSRPALHQIFLNAYETYSGHNGIEPCEKDQIKALACSKPHVIGQQSCQEA